MGQDMTYTAKSKELSFRLSPTDIDLWDALAKEGLKDELEAIFGVSEYDQKSNIKRTMLLKSIDHLIEKIESNRGMLPYTYLLETQVSSNIGMLTSVCEMISGIRIDGDIYSMKGGVGKCELIRMWKDKLGNVHSDKPRDVRHLKKIKTDNVGEITIRKKSKPASLVRNLKKLRSFLKTTKVDTVQKILS